MPRAKPIAGPAIPNVFTAVRVLPAGLSADEEKDFREHCTDEGIRVAQPFAFSAAQKIELRLALPGYNAEKVDAFIREVEHLAIAYDNWEEPAPIPGSSSRAQGLKTVENLARELWEALDGSNGIVGADWFNLNRALVKAIPGAVPPIEVIRSYLGALAVASDRLAPEIKPSSSAASLLQQLADELAYSWWRTFDREIPSGYASDDYTSSSPFMQVFSICLLVLRGKHVTVGQIRKPAQQAIRRVKKRASAEQTFEAAARAWLAATKWPDNEKAACLRSMEVCVFPSVGALLSSQLTPAQIVAVLRAVQARDVSALPNAQRVIRGVIDHRH